MNDVVFNRYYLLGRWGELCFVEEKNYWRRESLGWCRPPQSDALLFLEMLSCLSTGNHLSAVLIKLTKISALPLHCPVYFLFIFIL
jgi:hypothetical protein